MCYCRCLSSDYSGELKQAGDTVKIPTVGAVAVREYTRNADISYDQAIGSTLDIVIDNCSYRALKVDDLDVAQSKPAFLDACTKSAGYALRDTVDIDAAEVLATGAGNKLFKTTAFQVNGNVTKILAEISKNVDTANVPSAGRRAVLPPFVATELSLELIGKATPDDILVTVKICQQIPQYGLVFTYFSHTKWQMLSYLSIVSEGWINRCFGMDIFMSNNCPQDTGENTIILAGVREAGTMIA